MAGATMLDIESLEATGEPELVSSTYEVLERSAEQHADAPALSFFLTADGFRDQESWTYRELFARVTQSANLFHRLGATKQTVIAIALPNLLETHTAIWGGQAAGIVLPLNPLLEGPALAALLEATGAEILVTLAPASGCDLWEKLEPVLARLSALRHVVLVDAAARTSGRIDATRTAAVARALPERIGVHDFSASVREEPSLALVSERVFSASDQSSWFCTGGTTGRPKIAMRTHGSEVANARSVAQALCDGIGVGKVFFCGLPLSHVNGVLVTGLLPFSIGAHVILGTPLGYRTPELVKRFWEIIAHYRVNFFSGVPTLYSSLLQVPTGSHDISSLECGICGAAPMPRELFRTFEEHAGIKILEGYGLTEATCVSSLNPLRGERRIGSIGLPIPGQAMKTVLLDERGAYVRDCGVDEVGVIVVSGPNVFTGYHNPAQNERLWIDCGDDKRWLDTGDRARTDADGYFWLIGRTKDLIIRGGHNLDPAAIEEPLHRHPDVEFAAAVGRPDAHAGELPVAYVQLSKGATTTAADLLAFMSREISERAALPKYVRIIAAMPLTAVGKINKLAIKQLEAKNALETALHDADVEILALAIVDDASRGIAVQVELDRAASPESARRVLGRFAIPFTIVGGSP